MSDLRQREPRSAGPSRVLALNLGNTSLLAGVFAGHRLVRMWRVPVRTAATRAGFERAIVHRAGARLTALALSSVVPVLTTRILAHAAQAWPALPPQILDGAAAHRRRCLKIGYADPARMGADRVAAALGARQLFPRQNVIVVDAGTATTVTAVGRDGAVPGGAIFPGPALWAEALHTRTAQLPRIAVATRTPGLGRSTAAAIRAGLVHGHAGAVRELVARIRREAWPRATVSRVVVVGTGGGAAALHAAGVVTVLEPALVLQGLAAWAEA